ncbi:four-carbon acid sugar kinase family protein [Xinfangfangia sp. CPCC 101601]|uniref:Four-carbon acid sugar kinase family protein n=1 Tax=Pseudogemmobacter lacusdianii TaxID=3069608 RepID=A0ABU0W2V5_9RHOB|nr:four-carbon acid sugar kinase family protein [Xinfangfangia sp. CPCC 101601]MDQ2068243.1 four-carbon acid sugar kinase family protein [Xinfangfangia sp. CPCC 101601]
MTQTQAKLGVIADDFTGAVLVAGLLETEGVYCPILLDPQSDSVESAPVVMMATRSRTVAVAEALAEVGAACARLERAGCQQLAYKACASFDSTKDGNIGPVGDLLAQRAARRPVLMSAGFPRFGATVHQGYLFYRTRLVSESIKRFDPLTPMEDPDLVRFIGHQTPHSVGLISHLTMVAGAEATRAAFGERLAEGFGHILFDTSDDTDVERSSEIAAATGLPVVASDPLIVGLAKRLAAEAPRGPAYPSAPKGPVVTLAGSTGPVIMRQLDVLGEAQPVLTLDLLAEGSLEAQIATALDWAAAQGNAGFAISTACDVEALARSQAALGALPAARRAEALLSGVTTGLRARGHARFSVAGGETSGAVVAALGLGRLRALPEGALGTGECLSDDPAHPPCWLFLKPGKLGSDDILLRAALTEG